MPTKQDFIKLNDFPILSIVCYQQCQDSLPSGTSLLLLHLNAGVILKDILGNMPVFF